MTVKGVLCEGVFKVFKSGGAWDILIAKTLLESFCVVHDYAMDSILLP